MTALRETIAELIGTFMLVLVGAGSVILLGQPTMSGASSRVAGDVVVPALAHGLILTSIIFTFGHISGAHVNPAVTLGLLVGGKLNPLKALVYWIAQFAGGILAALVLRYIFPGAATLGNTLPVQGIDNVRIIVLEGLMTFFLVSVVFQAAVYGRAGSVAALAIGFTLAACILFGGPLTGASLNPARTLGPAFVTNNFTDIGAYMIGIFGGGAIAGLLHGWILRTV